MGVELLMSLEVSGVQPVQCPSFVICIPLTCTHSINYAYSPKYCSAIDILVGVFFGTMPD